LSATRSYPDRDPRGHHFSFPSFRDLQLPAGQLPWTEDKKKRKLLAGGDKGSQAKDIKTALALARNLSE
jgi:hypothetical protein